MLEQSRPTAAGNFPIVVRTKSWVAILWAERGPYQIVTEDGHSGEAFTLPTDSVYGVQPLPDA